MGKLDRSFYQRSALESVMDFLGKYLVLNSPQGVMSGMIVDVEAYPAFLDRVSHGNKRTKRTEVLYGQGGFAYVYLIYGKYYQLAVVVNKPDVPEVVFIRAVVPEEGIEIMKKNFGRPVRAVKELTKSPGNLCKSFGIDKSFYGTDLTGDTLFIEDRGVKAGPNEIFTDMRVGINPSLDGHNQQLRYYLNKT